MSSGPAWITMLVFCLLLLAPPTIWLLAWIRNGAFTLRSLFLLTAIEAAILGLIMVWLR